MIRWLWREHVVLPNSRKGTETPDYHLRRIEAGLSYYPIPRKGTETRLRKDPACILDPRRITRFRHFLTFHRKQDILIRSRMIDCLGA